MLYNRFSLVSCFIHRNEYMSVLIWWPFPQPWVISSQAWSHQFLAVLRRTLGRCMGFSLWAVLCSLALCRMNSSYLFSLESELCPLNLGSLPWCLPFMVSWKRLQAVSWDLHRIHFICFLSGIPVLIRLISRVLKTIVPFVFTVLRVFLVGG